MTGTETSNTKIISKLFFRLLPVQILLVAISSINSIIDGMIAGRLIGPLALTVIGLFFPVLKIIDSVNAVLTGGSQILCGQFLGKNEAENTRKVFSLDVMLTAVFSIALGGILLFMPWSLTGMLGADSNTAEGLEGYMRGISFGILAQMLCSQLSAFLQLEHQEKRTYVGIVVMMVSNLSLNILFVMVLDMGLFGLGLSTSISNWLFCIVQISYYFTKKAIIKFDFKSIDYRYFKDIVRIGIPGALVQFFLTVRGVAINNILLNISGNDGLAAYSAVGTFGCVYYAVTAGVASATRLLVSVYIGEEDKVGLYRIMRTALIKGVGLVLGASVVFMAMAVPFTGMFCMDTGSEVYQLTKQLFIIFPISMPFSCITVVFINYFQCCERMKIVNILSFVDGVAAMVLSSLVLSSFIGVLGVWFSQVTNGIITVSVALIYIIIVSGKFPTNIESLLLIPEDFGVPDSDRLNISINSIEGVLNTSEKVIAFCRDHDVDKKHSFYAGLCIEEMAGNIVRHGFAKDGKGKRNSVDITVVKSEEGILIRFKDNCIPFNPEERDTIFNPPDVTHNIGIRMIARISKKMQYQFVLGLNVLSVWV